MDAALEATLRQTELLYANFLDQVVRIRNMVASHDANLGKQLDQVTQFFKNLDIAIPSPEKPNFVIHNGEAKFGHFVVMRPRQSNLSAAAMWDGKNKFLILDPVSVKGGNHYLPFIICHEAFHALDSRTCQDPPDFTRSVVPVPAETDATAFESAVVNAVTQGRYSALVKRTAEEIITGKIPQISANGYSCFPMPKRLHGVLGSDKPLTLRSTGAACITTLFLHDVNLELVRRSTRTREEQARELELVYARRYHVGANPKAIAIVMDSIAKW